MKGLELGAVLVFVGLLSGCATQGIAPSPVSLEKERVFDAPFDTVWPAIIGGIAETNLKITTLEKASGLIAISDSPYSPEDAIEGTRGSVLGVPDLILARQASLNIFATSPSQDKTKVKVNLSMKMNVRRGNGSQAFPFVTNWQDSYSNGNIEKSILDGVDSRIRKNK